MNRSDENRSPKDLGSRSPASEEAKQQSMAGDRGAEAEGGEPQQQPPQISNRRGPEHRTPPQVRKGFPEGEAPSEQGEKGSRSPEMIARNQQGIGARSGKSAGGDRSEEEAVAGEPTGEHTRGGRQSIPGDREQNQ